ncbi:MAG: nuclease [Candidatus Kapaibacterium sp.]
MPVRNALWNIGTNPKPLKEISLGSEALLEEMIVRDSSILSDRWFLIGQQVRTSHGGFIDLLALNQDGQIILIELKREKTPREVVAQAIDYASWVQDLQPDEIVQIYDKFSGGRSLQEDFKKRFGIELDEEQLNGSHQIVVVASALDASTERIVLYLNSLDVPINIIFFQVFQHEELEFLSRTWLIDPVETESKASASGGEGKEKWNGEYYVSFGHDESRRWEDAVEYGFISAGGGAWYTKTLMLLSPGDRVWVNIPGQGYVGVGLVTGAPISVDQFQVEVEGNVRPFLDVARGTYEREFSEEEEKREYIVPVKWIETRPLGKEISEVGFFGNQNTVCRPRTTKWSHTIARLKRHFTTVEDGEVGSS